MWPTFMVFDKQGKNIEISNVWIMASHEILYVSEYYEQHILLPVVLHEVFYCPSFSELCF
jgi:hypothetical protein